MAKAQKLDIFRVLRALDQRNKTFYDSLTEEEKKSLSFYLLLRWASGVQDNKILQEWYVAETNLSVNRNFWQLNKHPQLLWMLFCQIGSTRTVRHEYIKRQQDKKDPILNSLMKVYPSAKRSDLEILSKILPPERIKLLIKEYDEFSDDF